MACITVGLVYSALEFDKSNLHDSPRMRELWAQIWFWKKFVEFDDSEPQGHQFVRINLLKLPAQFLVLESNQEVALYSIYIQSCNKRACQWSDQMRSGVIIFTSLHMVTI